MAAVRVPFVENCGQVDARVAYMAQASFGTAFVTQDGKLVYALPARGAKSESLTESFVSGNARPAAGAPSVTRVSRFHGSDPAGWQTNLPTFDEVRLGEVWPGVRVVLRAHGGNVEKLFTVEPGIRADKVRMRVDGAKRLRVDPDGSLMAETPEGDVRFSAPKAYQEGGGVQEPVEVAYVVKGRRYGFRLGTHDQSRAVVIDPILQSTYLGGTVQNGIFGDSIVAIAIEPETGQVLVGGGTSSPDFPGTSGGLQTSLKGYGDGFVARLDANLTVLLQATYLGGGDLDSIGSIVVHPLNGEVLVAGRTFSSDFPGTAGGAQPSSGGFNDGFVARLDPSLSNLLQSTYLGGDSQDVVNRLAVDPITGDVFATGGTNSSDFPGTTGGFQATYVGGDGDGFIARLNSALTTLVQATYLGGTDTDGVGGVAIEPSTGELIVAGSTASSDFPGTTGGAQPENGGFYDAFVARIDSSLTTLLQSTYLGGSGLEGGGLLLVKANEVIVAGTTDGEDFPHTAGGAQASSGGGHDGFFARLDSGLTAVLQATYFGGSAQDDISDLALEPSTGDVLVAGWGLSVPLPGTVGGAQSWPGGGYGDGFVVRFEASLTSIVQATYLGGQDFESAYSILVHPSTGEVYVAGSTFSQDFPATAGGAQPSKAGAQDGFITRFTPDLKAILAPFGIHVDPLPTPGDGNGIFEPGETSPAPTVWKNFSSEYVTAHGVATNFTGPGDSAYVIDRSAADYGSIAPETIQLCFDCYRMYVSAPTSRPAVHWDATFTETLDVPLVLPKKWTLHIGDSFSDVARTHQFYAYVENILHNGITGGCGQGSYCPAQSVTRAQMAVFLLKAKHGSGYQPPFCGGIFPDVECPGPFTDWIEQLSHEGITAGCGGGYYCPDAPVTREQMAVFLLKTKQGSGYTPAPATGIFGDVPQADAFAPWIEELYHRGVTGGCQGSPLLYCPDNPSTRGQMAAFLTKTFGLVLYGP